MAHIKYTSFNIMCLSRRPWAKYFFTLLHLTALLFFFYNILLTFWLVGHELRMNSEAKTYFSN